MSSDYFDARRSALMALSDAGTPSDDAGGQVRAQAYATLALAEAVIELAQSITAAHEE